MAHNTAGEGNNEELDQELEILRAMWSSEEELEIQRLTADAAAARLVARLAPSTGGKERSQYVKCEVVITVPCDYPGDPEHPVLPQVRLGASSGLTDARRASLLAALEDLVRGDFAGLPGALPVVLEAAQERLTAWNDEGPLGECPVCLARLDDGEAGLLRLPCYHVLHAACFAQLWEAEWLRQSEDGQRNKATAEENPVLAIPDAVVACPECRQVASWAAVPEIHPSFEHLLVSASIQKMAVVPESDRHDESREVEEGVEAEEDEAITYTPYQPPTHAKGASSSRQQQQKSDSARVDLFEVIMPRGLRTRLKPKWDARDQEGPVLRNGACGVVAEFVEGKDATYLRPEGTDYWLPLNGGRNNNKMVRIDQDMPRPVKAPSGWIHGDKSLGVDVAASTPPASAKTRGAKLAATSLPAEGKAIGKERKKKAKGNNAGDKLLGA